MNGIILTAQIILLAFTGVLALLMFVMVRQIGIIRQRIPEDLKVETSGLPDGARVPVMEFATYNGTARCNIPLAGTGKSFLLFTALSCPKCQTLLDQLPGLPVKYSEHLALLILDSDISERFAARLSTFGDFRVIEGLGMASSFQIKHSPFLYVVDENGIVIEKSLILTLEDMTEVMSRHKETENAVGHNIK